MAEGRRIPSKGGRFTAWLWAAILISVGPGCGPQPEASEVSKAGRGRSLTVAVFGGDYGNQARYLVGDLLESATGATIEYEYGTSRTFLEKLRKGKGSASFDVVYLDGIIQNLAVREGLLSKIEPSDLPAHPDLSEDAVINKGYGPGFQFFSVGMAINTRVFQDLRLDPPKTWSDLWTLAPRLKGRIAIPDIIHTAGMDLFLTAMRLAGTSLEESDGIAKTMAKVQELGADQVYRSSTRSAEALAKGQYGLLVTYNSRAFGKELDGAPVQWVIPEDKGFGHITTLSVAKGCKDQDLALAYINIALSPAVQIAQSLNSPYGPSNSRVFEVLREYPEISRRFPLGPEDMGKLVIPPWDVVNQHRTEIEAGWRKVFPENE